MKKTKNKKPPRVLQCAKGLVKYWQKQLRLLDWNITIEILDKPEENNFGSNQMNPDHQFCRIKILDPEKVPKDWYGIRDLEVTIVHELLHARLLYALGVKSANCHAELAIEVIAISLVSNRRGVKIEDLE